MAANSNHVADLGDHDDVRDKNIIIRLSAEERAAWQDAADKDGRTLSDWIRRRCNGDATTAPSAKRKPAPAAPQIQPARPSKKGGRR